MCFEQVQRVILAKKQYLGAKKLLQEIAVKKFMPYVLTYFGYFNPGLALTSLRTTGPRANKPLSRPVSHCSKKPLSPIGQ